MNLFDFFRPRTNDEELEGDDPKQRVNLQLYQAPTTVTPEFDWSRLQDDTPDSTRPKLVDPRYTTPIAAADAPVDSGRPVLQPMQQQAQPDQQPIQPLTDAPPPDAPMATRPRLVPPTYTPDQLASAEQNAQDVNTAVPELAAIGKAAKTGRDFTLSPLQEAQNKLSDLTDFQNNPVVNKGSVGPDGEMHKANFKGRLKDAALAALLGASQQVQANGGRANLGTIGAAAGGLAGGAINPAWNEQRARLQDIARTQNRVGQLQQQDKFASDQAYSKARTDNVYADNEFQKEKLKEGLDDKATARAATAAQKHSQQVEVNKRALARLKYFDPNNPAHMALVTGAEEDPAKVKGWDDRNPLTKVVAGKTYQYNRETKSYDPTDLPVDETKTATDYKVTMPDGEVRTYKVSQKDAANFSTQMTTLGAKLEQNDRQFQQKFQLDERNSKALNDARTFVNGLRQQELDLKRQQAVASDAASQARLAKEAADLATKQATLKSTWATKVGQGGFTEEMYKEMFPDE